MVLQQPLTDMYLTASAVMDMFVALDALDLLGFCGTDADGWYIPQAKAARKSCAPCSPNDAAPMPSRFWNFWNWLRSKKNFM